MPADPLDSADARDAHRSVGSLDRALDLVRFLRANCDWDAAQTPESLIPYLLEEAHETADAIVAGEDQLLPGELGDLLLNVAFQIVLAEERGAFDAEAVVRTLEAKMRRRHPHLYGDGVRVDWEILKRQEREAAATDGHATSLLDGIAGAIEPLSRAHRLQERAATVGFDWPDASAALEKVREEVEEVADALGGPAPASASSNGLEEEIGDLLFATVNVARLAGVHAMRALIGANSKFASRFGAVETLARSRGVRLDTASLDEMEALWQEVKRTGGDATDTAD